MKLAGGEWQRLSWEQVIEEIGLQLEELRGDRAGQRLLAGLGQVLERGSYLFRKPPRCGSVGGHRRMPPRPTVDANTWGYGAMTNSYNDIASKAIVIIGGNPTRRAHPVSLQHVLRGKKTQQGADDVCDPLHADGGARHALRAAALRHRHPLIGDALAHQLQEHLGGRRCIAQRVRHGPDPGRGGELQDPAAVERVTGVPEILESPRSRRSWRRTSRRRSSGA
ncbi:MAG: hypothetical protein R3D25_01940 [Geminicoccaceae bacterium]